MSFMYEDGDRKLLCIGCGNPTKGLLVVCVKGNPLPQKYSMCPRCRDTKAKHKPYEERIGSPIPQHIYRGEVTLPFEPLRPQKGISFWDLDESEQKRIIESPDWIADPKIDGARGLLYVNGDGSHLLSSRISKQSGNYSDRRENFPQITKAALVKDVVGTVLDGEIFIDKKGFVTGAGSTDSTLNETVACMNASPETAVRLQRDNDAWAKFLVFDCLKFRGEDIRGKPYYYRRLKAGEAVHLYGADSVEMLPCSGNHDLIEGWYSNSDHEGVVYKDGKAPYYAPSVGARNKGMVKKKRMETYDAYVTNFIRGEAGFKGLVGALVISQLKNGVPTEIGAVSNISLEQRKIMTDEKGNLKSEYYGRVVEVRAQSWTRKNRLRHCQLLRWRPDKTSQECEYVHRGT